MRTPSLRCGSPARSAEVTVRRGETAFTAIDVLIGTAILVIVLAVAVAVFQSAARANTTARAAAALRVATQNLVTAVERDCASAIACATPLTDVGNNPNSDGHEIAFYSRDAAGNGRFWSYCYRASGSGNCGAGARDGDVSLFGPYRWSELPANGGPGAAYQGRVAGNVALSARTLTTAQLVDGTANPLTGTLWSQVVAAPPDIARPTGFPGFTAGNRVLEVSLSAGSARRSVHVLAGARPAYHAHEVVGVETPTPNPIGPPQPGAPGNPSADLRFFAPIANEQLGGIAELNYFTNGRTTNPPQVYRLVSTSCPPYADAVPGGNLVPATDGSGLATVQVTPRIVVMPSGADCQIVYSDNVNHTQTITVHIDATQPVVAAGPGSSAFQLATVFGFTATEGNYAGGRGGVFTAATSGDCSAAQPGTATSAAGTYAQSFTATSTGPAACTFTVTDVYGQQATAATASRGGLIATHWLDTPGQTAQPALDDAWSNDSYDHWWTVSESSYSGSVSMRPEASGQCANFAFASGTSGGQYTTGDVAMPAYMDQAPGGGFAVHPVNPSLYMPAPCYVDIFDDIERANYNGYNGATLAASDPAHMTQLRLKTSAPPPTPVPTATAAPTATPVPPTPTPAPTPGGIVITHYYGTTNDTKASDLSDDFTNHAGYDHWWVGSEANYTGSFYTWHDPTCDNLAVATQSTNSNYVTVKNDASASASNLGPQTATPPYWAMHYIDEIPAASCQFVVYDDVGQSAYAASGSLTTAQQTAPGHVVTFTVDKPAKSIMYVDHWYDTPGSTLSSSESDQWTNDTHDHWWTPRQTFYFGNYYLHFANVSACDAGYVASIAPAFTSPPYYTPSQLEYWAPTSTFAGYTAKTMYGGGFVFHPISATSTPACTVYIYNDNFTNNYVYAHDFDAAALGNAGGDTSAGVVKVVLGVVPTPQPAPATPGPLTVSRTSFTWDPNAGTGWSAAQTLTIAKTNYSGWVHIAQAPTQNPAAAEPNNCSNFVFTGFGGSNAVPSQVNEPYANGAGTTQNGSFSVGGANWSCTAVITSDDPNDVPVLVQLDATPLTVVPATPTPAPIVPTAPPSHTQQCVDATGGNVVRQDWQYLLTPDSSPQLANTGIDTSYDTRFTAAIVGDRQNGMHCTAVFVLNYLRGTWSVPNGTYTSNAATFLINFNGPCSLTSGSQYYHSPGGGGCSTNNGAHTTWFYAWDIVQYSPSIATDRLYFFNWMEDYLASRSKTGFCTIVDRSRAEDSFVWAMDYTYQGSTLDIWGMPGYFYQCITNTVYNPAGSNWPYNP